MGWILIRVLDPRDQWALEELFVYVYKHIAEVQFASSPFLEDIFILTMFRTFAWFLDITPNGMFSLYEYPIPGKNGLPLCEEHGQQLELKEVVLYDREATEMTLPDHCWVCTEQGANT